MHTIAVTVLNSNFQRVPTSGVPTSQGQKVFADEELENEKLAFLCSCVYGTLSGVSMGGLVAPLAVRMNPHWFLSTHPSLQQPTGQVQVAQSGSNVEGYLQLKSG